jgi:hypothetical protein
MKAYGGVDEKRLACEILLTQILSARRHFCFFYIQLFIIIKKKQHFKTRNIFCSHRLFYSATTDR